MSERTFEVGGEVLKAGDTVFLFDGNSRRERVIVDIGTKRIFLDAGAGSKPVPFSKEDRHCLQGRHGGYFRTKTEVAEDLARDLVASDLRDLGFQGDLRSMITRYGKEPLEEVVRILKSASSK